LAGQTADPEAEYPVFTLAEPGTARAFLKAFARNGGGIVVQSVGYDFGAGDLAGMTVVSGLPHAVMAVLDFRSLWTRMAVLSDAGMGGERDLQFCFVDSEEFPDEFGLLLRGASVAQPIVVMPALARNVAHMVSAADALESPFGTRIVRPTDTSFDAFTRECEHAVNCAVEAFGESLGQPDLDPDALRFFASAPEWGLPVREKLRRAASA
jgi:hypothetical protein